MRKLILQEFVTLDGLAAGPKNSVDFVPAATRGDASFGREQLAFIETIDTMLLGRVTYELFVGYWPAVTQGDEKPFADRFNAARKLVFSKTLDRAPWGDWGEARIVKTSPERAVADLKAQTGKDIVLFGSISLAQSLIAAGLVDVYRLVVCPVVLGEGRRLFGDKVEQLALQRSSTKAFDRGAALLEYVPTRAGS
ncbi:MAG TPA: dihydrofolate reductase family protein [Myxococcaceae bacterium]|nr:dihydrofolate reductase family protein [Myxococcaceae bacterium]